MDFTNELKAHNGAQFFDAKIDDWFHTVEVEVLDMARADLCVIGQLFGHYHYGRNALGLTQTEACNLGLDARRSADYDELDHYWQIEILERRIAAAAALLEEVAA